MYKLPKILKLNAFELGQIMAVLRLKGKYENLTPALKRKLTKATNDLYR